jgi:hypothetical protein
VPERNQHFGDLLGLGTIKRGNTTNVGYMVGKTKRLGSKRRKLAWLEIDLRGRDKKLCQHRSSMLLEYYQELA